MSKPPERIWLQWHGDNDDPDFDEPNQVMDEVTWHRDRVFEHDVEYVAASRIESLEAEIERLKIPQHGYEEMSAKYARNIEECAAKVRALEEDLQNAREGK